MGNLVALTSPERSVCVYCASSFACDPHFHDVARLLGSLLAGAGWSVVYGGGRSGSMGALAEGALAAGGRVIGIIPRFMVDLEWGNNDVSELHVVEDMRARKHEMLTRSKAVIALPGGTGTFEELFEAMTLKRLGIFLGPIVLVNTRGYYDPLLAQMAAAIDGRFMDERHASLWNVVADPQGALATLEAAPEWSAASRDFAVVR
jgi:uncharacterized protein (TIGR00730 family)